MELGILGLIVLALDIWAVINVLQSPTTSNFGKLLWILFIVIFPVVGFIVWLVFGPRGGTRRV